MFSGNCLHVRVHLHLYSPYFLIAFVFINPRHIRVERPASTMRVSLRSGRCKTDSSSRFMPVYALHV